MNIKPEEIFNRVNEAKFASGDEGITPSEWSRRKVKYYQEQIDDSSLEIQKEFNTRLLNIWEAVATHYESK